MKLPSNIDLHGLEVHQGFNKAFMYVRLCKQHGKPDCKIITGRSGKMKREFPHWAEGPMKNYIESFKEFDDRGTFLVKIKRS